MGTKATCGARELLQAASYLIYLANGLPAGSAVRALQLIAIAAIDRSVTARQEWHLGLIATTGADHRMHLPWLTLASSAVAAASAHPSAA